MVAFLKKTIAIFLFGNFYISIGAASFLISTCLLNNYKFPLFYISLVFFSTLFIYNLQRIFYIKYDDNEANVRRKWINDHTKTIKIIAFCSIAATFILLTFIPTEIYYLLLPLFILSILYFTWLRKNGVIKTLTLASVWTVATEVALHQLNNYSIFSSDLLLQVCNRFFFILSICIPFDLRDYVIDKKEHIKTLPHLVGINSSKFLSFVCLIFCFIISVIQFQNETISNLSFKALLCSYIFNGILLMFLNSKRGEYYYTILIDGSIIFQTLMLLLFQNIE